MEERPALQHGEWKTGKGVRTSLRGLTYGESQGHS